MTIPNRDIQILQKIQGYCDDIMFTHTEYDRNYNTFCSNPTYRNAIALCLLQIGELVKKLSDEFVQSHTTIPWKAIRGMRNVVAHEYGHIDIDTIWETSETGIIELRDFCAAQIRLQQGQNSFSDLTISCQYNCGLEPNNSDKTAAASFCNYFAPRHNWRGVFYLYLMVIPPIVCSTWSSGLWPRAIRFSWSACSRLWSMCSPVLVESSGTLSRKMLPMW